MADSDQTKKPGTPPKIKLSIPNGEKSPPASPSADADQDAMRIDLSAVSTNLDAARTDLESARADLGESDPDDTARIDLPKPAGPAGARPDTAKVMIGGTKPADPDDTTRIDLPKPPPKIAPRIVPPGAAAKEGAASDKPAAADDTSRIDLPRGKSETARVRLDEARPAAPAQPGAVKDAEQQILLKKRTLPMAKPAPRSQTARVSLDDARPVGTKPDITRAETVVASAAAATQPVESAPKPDSEDVFKRSTESLETKPGTEPEGPPRSATARVSAPVEAEKSKTARIEVPAELATAGTGRPKTIRIKRADSAAAGPQAAIPEPVIKKTTKGKKKAKRAGGRDAEVGALYSAIALLSLILIGLVVYVLVAQVLDPSLPWIGKITL